MSFKEKIPLFIQYIAPQHALSRLAGWLAECRWKWLKTILIHYFIKRYPIQMSEAIDENPDNYPNFNSLFTRRLKPICRPVTDNPNSIASPADGCISEVGRIRKEGLLQAKHYYYRLDSLFGGCEKEANAFIDGHYITIYLAPKDYHRVHLPLAGRLHETIYIPGKLFSVNTSTTDGVPGLFSRNERLVSLFETAVGPMAVIMVGAMLVGHIQPVWSKDEMIHPSRLNKITRQSYSDAGILLKRGDEMGLFKMGSTVIVLFPKQTMQWADPLQKNTTVRMGESIGFCG